MYTLGDVETRLVELVGTRGKLSALRARMRYLRNLGLLDLPKVGRGNKNTFGEIDVFQFYVSLEVEMSGHPPKIAIDASRLAKSHFYVLAQTDRRIFLLISRNSVSSADEDAVKQAIDQQASCSVVNLRQLIDRLTLSRPGNERRFDYPEKPDIFDVFDAVKAKSAKRTPGRE